MISLTLVRRIEARPQVIFDAVTTVEGMAQWWGPDILSALSSKSAPRVADRHRMHYRMLDSSEHASSGEFLEIMPPQWLVSSWRWRGDAADAGGSPVTHAVWKSLNLDTVPTGWYGRRVNRQSIEPSPTGGARGKLLMRPSSIGRKKGYCRNVSVE